MEHQGATVKRELRCARGLEVREADKSEDGSIATISGYAAVFDSPSEVLGWFTETIRKGAFGNSLKRGDDIRALGHHNTEQIIGRRSAKTLRVSEDEKGLKVEIAVPDTTYGRDLVTSIKRGDLTGMSFGFETVTDTWTTERKDEGTLHKRELIEVNLFEVSVVAFPAYTDTSAEARGLARSAKEVLEAGRRGLGTEARARRDRLIEQYKTRMALVDL